VLPYIAYVLDMTISNILLNHNIKIFPKYMWKDR